MPPPRRPKIDPIARVQSHGLRRKLREYYEVEGSGDPIPIQFPTGRYLPIFNCIMAQKSGMGENFDAQTGDALRDPAYTWTSSVFLVFAHELTGRGATPERTRENASVPAR